MKRPELTTPGKLFDQGARYKAPVFQRFYVWGRKQLEGLADDIEQADPEIGQFLGAIVLKDLGKSSGPTSPTEYLIIDGQQRLSTLYLLLSALAKRANENGYADDAEYLATNFLIETRSPAYRGWPKLVVTLQDRSTFQQIARDALPELQWDFQADPAEERPRTSKKLHEQWERVKAHVVQATSDANGRFSKDQYDQLVTATQDYLHMVCITLEASDDANAIFSRLNAKGVPLELSDLVRNEVFSKFRAGDAGQAERFHSRQWEKFEKGFAEGELSKFFPIYAYIVLKGRVTKAAAFGALQARWKDIRPPEILADLKKYAPYFQVLVKYKPDESLPRQVSSRAERLSRMPKARVTWPFLVEVLRASADGRLGAADAVRTLKIVEAFLVRRALVGNEPTGLHAVFKTLWEKTKGAPDEVRSKIVTRTIKSPGDHDVRQALLQDASDTRVMMRYVLEEFERHTIREHRYDELPKTALTIEHVLPQHLNEAWRAAGFTADTHKKCVRLLGNLTPLSEKQNKSLQDQPWSEKRRRFQGSNFKTTQKLAQFAQWTPEIIQQRTEALTNWIVSEWPELSSL